MEKQAHYTVTTHRPGRLGFVLHSTRLPDGSLLKADQYQIKEGGRAEIFAHLSDEELAFLGGEVTITRHQVNEAALTAAEVTPESAAPREIEPVEPEAATDGEGDVPDSSSCTTC